MIDVYVYAWIGHEVRFFLFQRSDDLVYAKQWRMIGGKVKGDETFWQAALREFKEETQLQPLRFWTLPSVNTFYEHQTDSIHHIPAFAIEVLADATPVLNHEHRKFAHFSANEAANILQWSEQQRLLLLADTLICKGAILPDWEVDYRKTAVE
jgi:dihydroneopterin triphosphate diphosphatase